ncbi:phage protein GemA/Gp16 family protein [Ferrovibrio sp.]|uniref:phage protein GemA/Gp16 family protein n=1 Tax=Ferrovibrio sp. TaxID=1917215 RepID=UPI0035AF44AA
MSDSARYGADRAKLIKAVHACKTKKGIDDEAYRDILERDFKAKSSTELDNRQLGSLLTTLNGGKWYRPKSSKPYVRMIFGLWAEMCRLGIPDYPTRAGLKAFVKRQADVADPEWLTPETANAVIEALKAWKARELAKRAAAVKESTNG